MSSTHGDTTSPYRVESVTPEYSKLQFGAEERLRNFNPEDSIAATIKVAQAGYVPPGVEVRTRVSPLIFTANLPYAILEHLERDPDVVSIEPAYNLKPYSKSGS